MVKCWICGNKAEGLGFCGSSLKMCHSNDELHKQASRSFASYQITPINTHYGERKHKIKRKIWKLNKKIAKIQAEYSEIIKK